MEEKQIFKTKGDVQSCGNYRQMKLVSQTMKEVCFEGAEGVVQGRSKGVVLFPCGVGESV